MGRWNSIQDALMEASLNKEKGNIIKKNISLPRIKGTIYYREKINYKKGLLLVHGMSGNRYGLGVLAERLADYGYFCLSIDLPSHFQNTNTFTMGELCDTINEGVLFIKNYGISRVGIIGHSMGAVGSLFSNVGYNTKIEKELYTLWEKLRLLDNLPKDAQNKLNLMKETTENIEAIYVKMKQLILNSLREKIQTNSHIDCLVLLAPPLNCKEAIPALSLLNKLNHKWIKKIFETLFHNPAVNQTKKEGNPAGFEYENKPENLYWQFFKTSESKEFLDYFLNMKEPKDYMKLIEDLAKLEHVNDKINFFEYYQKKYLIPKPKLFIYGNKDLYLKPFLPFVRGRLEKFYESCGNAEIHYGNFTHVMMNDPNQQLAIIAVKNDKVTKLIMKFLDKHL
ncbi:MAG: esterase/lipase family protein [Candidatus Woesearchaeota archaeon]